jgi:hypothetical protein
MAEEELTPAEFTRWRRETGERELGQLLLWRWDPIGVACDPTYVRSWLPVCSFASDR